METIKDCRTERTQGNYVPDCLKFLFLVSEGICRRISHVKIFLGLRKTIRLTPTLGIR